jgi:hypothetical protein
MTKRKRPDVLAAVSTRDPSLRQRSADELLADLEVLDQAVRRKVEISSRAVQRRYETELLPKLEEVRKLVERGSTIARNAAEYALVRFREFSITAGAPMA